MVLRAVVHPREVAVLPQPRGQVVLVVQMVVMEPRERRAVVVLVEQMALAVRRAVQALQIHREVMVQMVRRVPRE